MRVSGGGQDLAGFGGFEGFARSGSINDIFGDIFGDLFGGAREQVRGRGRRGRTRTVGRPGPTLEHQVDITFEEAAFGAEKVITVPKTVRAKPVDGSGAKPGTQPEDLHSMRRPRRSQLSARFLRHHSTLPEV